MKNNKKIKESIKNPVKRQKKTWKERKRNILLSVSKLKNKINVRKNRISAWYKPKKELRAFFILISQILLDGLLVSIPFWIFVKFNILTIFAFGAGLAVLKKQIIPIASQILGSISIVRITK